jgi:glycosyltransferase involved in cell wall biosynthesis
VGVQAQFRYGAGAAKLLPMGKSQRLKLGIILNFSPKWMGGVIYIINVVKILNWLDEDKKPEVKLFYRPELKRFVDEIEYPYLEAIPWSFTDLRSGYLRSWLNRKNLFIEPILEHRQLDTLFPVMDFPVQLKTKVRLISWYADLQHKYYPRFFSRLKRLERDMRIRLILRFTDRLIVSSDNVASDFNRFFHLPDKLDVSVFRFVSVIDSFTFTTIDEIRLKHHIPEQYFLVSNQFHQHKNHQIILEALAILKSKGRAVPFIAMTGKLPEDNTSAYILRLKATIKEYGLEQHVCFLGVLSRQDQLTLMRFAQAIIQPSLFEGWSTVIEDAISLQTPVIASDLPVNMEQLEEKGVYFPKDNAHQLALTIGEYPCREDFNAQIYEDYDAHVQKAAYSFLSSITLS